MNPTIKARIESIRRGEVPEGYKRTKIGIVPNDWSEERLKHYFRRMTRKNLEKNQNVLTISAQYGLISQEEFFNKSVASEDKSNYFLMKKGDFAYNKSYSNGYPYGAIKRLEYYEKGIVSPLYICLESLHKNTSDYFVQYFEAGLLNKEIHAVAQEGARNHGLLNIAVDDLFSVRVVVPKVSEQQKIAEILETQDKLIKLQERLIEEYKKLKKYFLSKMFPKKGCNYPEIRFPEFTAPWEQRKLGEYIEVSNDKNTENVYGKQDVLSVSGDFGVVNQIEFQGRSFAGVAVSNYGILHTGEVVYTKSPLNANPYGIIKTNKGKTGIVSVLYGVYRSKAKVCMELIQTYFEMDARLNNYLRPLVNKGAKNTLLISDEHALEGEIIFPACYQEQCMIYGLFNKLDNLITLHQRKLDEMKIYKKALMQLLLTGIVRVNSD